MNNGSTTTNFGSEIDLTLSYKYNDNVMIEGNASLFSPGDIFKEKKGSDNATWFYLNGGGESVIVVKDEDEREIRG